MKPPRSGSVAVEVRTLLAQLTSAITRRRHARLAGVVLGALALIGGFAAAALPPGGSAQPIPAGAAGTVPVTVPAALPGQTQPAQTTGTSGTATTGTSGSPTTGTSGSPVTGASGYPMSGGAPGGGTQRPNIIFVLTDDLSMNLLPFMPHVQEMERFGMTFSNYFVTDSLCCPSRSSIFTGDFPHDTHVFNNVGRDGGFSAFYAHGDQRRTFALALQRRGYLTAMMGKYLNGYMQRRGAVRHLRRSYVPPGWSQWDVAGWGYPEFNYAMNQDGHVARFGDQPADYLTDVLSADGQRFIGAAASQHRPFFLEVATFSPHDPFVPAPADAQKFPGLQQPRTPNFNRLPTDPPLWLRDHAPLTPEEIAANDRVYRLRAQDVQSVDRMIAALESMVIRTGQAQNTYLFFSSDNGLHTGQYRLMPGKMTAFDTDIHVPLVVIGPGVPYGGRSSAMTENVDLAETFAQLAGTSLPGDGHSLVGLLHGQAAPDWRSAILVEHHGPDLNGTDPDFQQPASGSPRTYEALRTASLLYVEYDDGERELYNLRADPFELHNLAYVTPYPALAWLHRALLRLRRCHGSSACWAAGHVQPLAGAPGSGL